MLSFGPEITEARKEIKNIIEVMGMHGLAHVMLIEMEVVILELMGICDTAGGEINPCYVVAFVCQDERMPASSGS
jgi:hypothetical protein